MALQPPIKSAFDKRAEVEFQRRFTTPEAQSAAREVQGRGGKLLEQARGYRDARLKNIVKETQDKPQPRLTPRFIGRLFGQGRTAQRTGFSSEQDRLQRRSVRIQKATDNELQRIEQRQHDKQTVQPGYLAGQFSAPDRQETRAAPEQADEHAPPQEQEQEYEPAPMEAGGEEVQPADTPQSWTPEEREAAINAEYDAQADAGQSIDYDPGRLIE